MEIKSDRPAYRVLASAGFYADDKLWEEGDTLYFDGEPNEDLEPLNNKAKEKLTIYIEKLDDLARKAAEKLGRPFVGRPRDPEGALSLAREDERRRVSIMGVRKEATQTEALVQDPTPETGQKPKPNFSIAA